MEMLFKGEGRRKTWESNRCIVYMYSVMYTDVNLVWVKSVDYEMHSFIEDDITAHMSFGTTHIE